MNMFLLEDRYFLLLAKLLEEDLQHNRCSIHACWIDKGIMMNTLNAICSYIFVTDVSPRTQIVIQERMHFLFISSRNIKHTDNKFILRSLFLNAYLFISAPPVPLLKTPLWFYREIKIFQQSEHAYALGIKPSKYILFNQALNVDQ